MLAITLHRPWPYAIAYLGKDIENCTWQCPLPKNSQIAIHAGKAWDEQGVKFIQALGLEVPSEPEHPTGVIAVATFQGNFHQHSSRWFVGPVGWFLSNALVLPEPVPCSGKQKLWRLEASALTQVMRQIQNG